MQLLTRSISVYLGALPRIELAPQGGIEPPTNGLTVRYSAAELLGNKILKVPITPIVTYNR